MNQNSMPQYDAVSKIKIAKNHFLSNLITLSLWREGKITYSEYPRELKLNVMDKRAEIIPLNINHRLLDIEFSNDLKAAFGVSATSLHSVFVDEFGRDPLSDSDPDRRAIRSIIYQVRNAFSHNPLMPEWVINKKYRQRFIVEEIDLDIDFTELDGQSLRESTGIEQMIEFHKVLDFSMRYFTN